MGPEIEQVSLAELAAKVPDGALLALPPDYSGVPFAAGLALLRRGARGLRLLTVPQAGMLADLLIGAGAVREVETAAVTLGEQGIAPRFSAAVEAGEILLRDSTCPAIHAALQAAEKGLPFLPLRGLLGSDILKHRPDWRVIDNPFAEGDPLVLLPAIRPDVALFHAPLADREGNVWIGRRRELATMAHAAERTFVTVERIQDKPLFETETTAAGALSGLYVEAVALAPGGAWPIGLWEHYGPDRAMLARYAKAARRPEDFARLLDELLSRAEAA